MDVSGPLSWDELVTWHARTGLTGELVDAAYVAAASDVVYVLQCTDGRFVLKIAGDHDDALLELEPRLVEQVAARTDIPVPEVVWQSDGMDERTRPGFVMEYVDGDVIAGPEDLPDVGEQTALARQVARTLRSLHDAFTYRSSGLLGSEGGAVVVADPVEWPVLFETELQTKVEAARSSTPALASAVAARLRTTPPVRTPSSPSLLHRDLRYDNLVIDRSTGTVNAVVDWGTNVSGDPAFDSVRTAAFLSGWPSERRGRETLVSTQPALRETVLEVSRDADGRDDSTLSAYSSRTYLLHLHLTGIAGFDRWYASLDATAQQRVLTFHTNGVRRWLDWVDSSGLT